MSSRIVRSSVVSSNPTGADSTGQTMIYTPVDVLIVSSIRGPSTPGPSRFLIAGGTVGCHQLTVDAAPRVRVGSRYVFILGGAFDAEGDELLPFLESKFAWPVDSAGFVATVDGDMSLDGLTEIVLETSASPAPQE